MIKAKKAFTAAAKHLHTKQMFSYQDKPVKQLHRALNDVFTDAVDSGIQTEMPAKMLNSLRNDVFIFSGMKTYAQLKEASLLLASGDGKIKPFLQFADDVKKINDTYNENYLQAEYQFATGSAAMASKWADVDPANDLQYRTAQDNRVRPDHAALANITLPATDPFWDSYYPPNGWNCRCTAVEVVPGKYTRSDSNEAIRQGENATSKIDKNGKNSMEIFRFNPGKQQVVFPQKHPYYAQHCGKKLNVSGNIGLAMIMLNNEIEKCEWQKLLTSEISKLRTDIIKVSENEIVYYPNLVDKKTSDYKNILTCCKHFATTTKEKVIMLPKFADPKKDVLYKQVFGDLLGTKYEFKQPDFKVGNKYYELEGFTTNNLDKAINNMLRRGLKQASRIVIEDTGIEFHDIKRTLFYRRRGGITIDEVWVLFKDGKMKQVL